ncbi:MAG: hypothetical protein NTY61_03590 [Candidatus Parcubacteria bacterium]|nr:hypothetical protein [Candidatus Parcubacteria bacterium]
MIRVSVWQTFDRRKEDEGMKKKTDRKMSTVEITRLLAATLRGKAKVRVNWFGLSHNNGGAGGTTHTLEVLKRTSRGSPLAVVLWNYYGHGQVFVKRGGQWRFFEGGRVVESLEIS